MIKIGTVNGDVIEAGGVKNVTNNYYGEAAAKPADEMPSDDRLAEAIEGCQAYFWANSAYAVLFCLLRDEYGMADNMSQFETKVELLSTSSPSASGKTRPAHASRNSWKSSGYS